MTFTILSHCMYIKPALPPPRNALAISLLRLTSNSKLYFHEEA